MQMMPINLEAMVPMNQQGAPAAAAGNVQFPQLLQQQLGAVQAVAGNDVGAALSGNGTPDLAALLVSGTFQADPQLSTSGQSPGKTGGLVQGRQEDVLEAKNGEGTGETDALMAAMMPGVPVAQPAPAPAAQPTAGEIAPMTEGATKAQGQDGPKADRTMPEAAQLAQQTAEADTSVATPMVAAVVLPQAQSQQAASASLSDHRFAQLLQGKPAQEPAGKVKGKIAGELHQAVQPAAVDAGQQQLETPQLASEGLKPVATAPAMGASEVNPDPTPTQGHSAAIPAVAGEGGRFAASLAEAKAPEQGTGLKLTDGRTLPESQVVDQVVGRFSLNRSEQQSRMTMQLHSGQDGERGMFQDQSQQQQQQPSFARRFTLSREEGQMESRDEDERKPRNMEGLSLRV